MKKGSWLLAQIKEIEMLAEEIGHDGVVHGLKNVLLICSQEAENFQDSSTPRSAREQESDYFAN
ncbi:hypothetical protein [uncultured Roseobacter sp.]|uniref:hypothetical protein n=1 Tax=uncultured Roseobacter sp. TaxID=114847 RepID=UPI00263038AC|nr:hypothetical protein [uncultured Roseobacter sp.]